MSTDSDLAKERSAYLDHKGFKIRRPDPNSHFWRIVDNTAKELDGSFTDIRNIQEAIDLYLEKQSK